MEGFLGKLKAVMTALVAVAILVVGGYWYMTSVKPYKDAAYDFLSARDECAAAVGEPFEVVTRNVNISTGGAARFGSAGDADVAWVTCDVNGPGGQVAASVAMTTTADGGPEVLGATLDAADGSGELSIKP